MTPRAASTAARQGHPRRLTRTPAGRSPRRVSGPARRTAGPAAPPKARVSQSRMGAGRALAPALPGAARSRGAAAPTPLGVRIARGATGVWESRWLDRLLRGRLWIAIVAIGLIGLVFMQLSLLRINAQMGGDVQRAMKLETQIASVSADVNSLSRLERMQDAAASGGFILPATGMVTFLGDGGKAVGGDTPPVPTEADATVAALPTLSAEEATAAATAHAAGTTTTDPAVAAPTTTTTTTTDPATAAAPVAAATTPTPVAATPAPTTTGTTAPTTTTDPSATTATVPPATTSVTAPPATASTPTATGGAVPE